LPPNTAQLRAELAYALRARSDLESKLSATTEELTALKFTNEEQTKRIAHLERIKELLERRSKDRADELKGKGSLMDSVQNEMVALSLELNMVQQENNRLKDENTELQRKWMEQMEKERKIADEERHQFDAKRR
jgi:chromosome segregation ATPase